MSQSRIIVNINPTIKNVNPTISINDNAFYVENKSGEELFSEFYLNTNLLPKPKDETGITNMNISITQPNSTIRSAIYQYKNTTNITNIAAKSSFETTNKSFSTITFKSPLNGIFNFVGDYTNTISNFSNQFKANKLEIIKPSGNIKSTTFNFYFDTELIGVIIYDPSENSYTATSNNSIFNYQNLVILANKAIVHYTQFPNKDPVTPEIFNAMYSMNAYALNRALNFV